MERENSMSKNNDFIYDEEEFKRAAKQSGKWLRRFGWLVVLAVVVVIFAFNSTYQINEQEQAVLVTLGKPQSVTDSGLHFKIPFIQKVIKVDTTIHGFTMGYNTGDDGYVLDTDESLMITSDYNFVNVDFFVEYKVTDPVKAIYNSQSPELILKILHRAVSVRWWQAMMLTASSQPESRKFSLISSSLLWESLRSRI